VAENKKKWHRFLKKQKSGIKHYKLAIKH